MKLYAIYILFIIPLLINCSSTPPKNIASVKAPITKQTSPPSESSRVQEANKENTNIFLTKVKKSLQSKPITLKTMVETSRYIQSQTIVKKTGEKYGIYSEAADEATKLIKHVVNKNAIAAAKNYANNITSPNNLTFDFAELKFGPFRALTEYLDPEKESQINQFFSTEKERAFKRIIDNEKKHYAENVYTSHEGLNKLKSLNAYELSLNVAFISVIDNEQMKKFNIKRSVHRQNLLNKHMAELTALIEKINDPTDLKTFHDDYLVATDYYSSAGHQFSQVYSDRLDVIAPFIDIREGRDYLAAIYKVDYNFVFKYDIDLYNANSNNRQYRNIFKNLNIKDKYTREALRKISSKFKDVFVQYLVNYEAYYSGCLKKDYFTYAVARHFPEVVTRNGYGVETSRTRGYTKYYKFKVPHKFKEMILQLGDINRIMHKGFLGSVLDSGIPRTMRTYSCGSNKIKQLEDGFIEIYRILYPL